MTHRVCYILVIRSSPEIYTNTTLLLSLTLLPCFRDLQASPLEFPSVSLINNSDLRDSYEYLQKQVWIALEV